MINTEDKAVYLACGPTDMRKQIDGLAETVISVFGLDAFSSALFVFCNRKRDILRVLEWDTDGFWLHTKRLERGHFMWPADRGDQEAMGISGPELLQVITNTALEKRFKGAEVSERAIY